MVSRPQVYGAPESAPHAYHPALEEPKRFRAVADQQILRLLIVVESQLVRFTAESRLLVPAEGRMGGIGVIAVRPHATCLDFAADAVGGVAVARPHARSESVRSVVADGNSIFHRAELRDRKHRSEDLFLEDAHLVVADEDRRLHVVAFFEIAAETSALASGHARRAFLLAVVDVTQDLLELRARGLWAHHGRRIKRIAHFDLFDPSDRALHETVEDGLLDQRARGARADFTFVEGEEREAFERLVEVVVV